MMDKKKKKRAGDGGDLVFRVGCGGTGKGLLPGHPGRFVFQLADGAEYFVITGKGKAYVAGTLVGEDRQVFDAFRIWLKAAMVESTQP